MQSPLKKHHHRGEQTGRTGHFSKWLKILGALGLVAVVAWFWLGSDPVDPDRGLMIKLKSRSTGTHTKPKPSESSNDRVPVSSIQLKANSQPSQVDLKANRAMPTSDDWESERLGEQAATQLHAIERYVTDQESSGISADDLATSEFSSTALVPSEQEAIYRSGRVSIQRWAGKTQPPVFQGVQGLARMLASLADRHGTGAQLTLHLKAEQIEIKLSGFSTVVHAEFSATTPKAVTQWDADWHCRWTMPNALENQLPKLVSIELKTYEQATYAATTGDRMFVEVTPAAMEKVTSYDQQMLPGISDWLRRLTRVEDMDIYGHHGITVGDVNGDGLDDLYVCDGGGLPNRLYVQQPDGTLLDESAKGNVDWLEGSRAALLIDLDNDGDQDLVVSTVALLLFAENDGSGKFTLKGGYPVADDSHSLCAADFDNDGDLDIYVCNYARKRSTDGHGRRGFEAAAPMPYHDANNGGRNILLANEGAFKFTDVTKSVGLDEDNTGWSLAAAWEDYDNDGDVDIYVANDFGRNNLYRNDKGKFTSVGLNAGVQDRAAGMSVAWGDYDGDSRTDLYVGNMFSAAGNRVTYQRRFDQLHGSTSAKIIQRMARGNTLFRNTGDGHFNDVSLDANANRGRWAWSSQFADVNNDGWLDIVVANGFLTNDDTDDL